MNGSIQPAEILKKVRQLEIRIRGQVQDLFAGEYHSVFKGQGMEFAEVREYTPGDDIRNIDWNVTARMNHPFVKVFHEERELSVFILYDGSMSNIFSSRGEIKKNLGIELSAVLAFSALLNNDKVGLIIFTDTIEKFVPIKKGKKHILRVFREMVAFQPQNKATSIRNVLEYVYRFMAKRATIFLISDFWDTGYDRALKILSQKHDLVGIHLIDPFELDPPRNMLIDSIDPETGERFILDTHDSQNWMILKKNLSQQIRNTNELFSRSRVDKVTLRTDQDYVVPLSQFFKKRERRFR